MRKPTRGKSRLGMSGKLSGHHMASLQFEKMNGIKLPQVTFTGAAPQVTALLGGHVEAIWGNSSDLVSYTTQMKILGIGTEKRMEALSGVPTFQELGMKFYRGSTGGWLCLGRPRPISRRSWKKYFWIP